MSDDHHDPPQRPRRPDSDYERFALERKRYAEAKREARMLKSLHDEDDPTRAGEHPWLQASKMAKSEGDQLRSRPAKAPHTSRLWFAGIAFLVCVSLSVYGALRITGAPQDVSTPVEMRTKLTVWHSLDGHELIRLQELAAMFSLDEVDVVLSHRAEIERAIRQSLFQNDGPDVIILSEPEARSLAQLGIFEPIDGTSQAGHSFLPLVEPFPWSTPLVAAIPRRRGYAPDLEVGRGFVHHLREHLRGLDRPSILPVP